MFYSILTRSTNWARKKHATNQKLGLSLQLGAQKTYITTMIKIPKERLTLTCLTVSTTFSFTKLHLHKRILHRVCIKIHISKLRPKLHTQAYINIVERAQDGERKILCCCCMPPPPHWPCDATSTRNCCYHQKPPPLPESVIVVKQNGCL